MNNDRVVIPMGRRGKGAGVARGGSGLDAQRHEVHVHVGRINVTVDQAEDGLIKGRSPYYARGDVLVRLSQMSDEERAKQDARGIKRDAGAPVLVQATPAGLLEDFEATCEFWKMHSPGQRDKLTGCPPSAPQVYLSRAGRWRVPPVRGIAQVPVLQADGSQLTDGYEPAHRLVVCAGDGWPDVPQAPDSYAAQDALKKVLELIAGFCFVDDSDRAVTLAAMLSAVMRPVLPTCPAFGWTAPVRGSGKSKLADICSILATGRTAAVLSWTAQEEENEKRLGSALLSGDPVILLDNIEHPLRSSALNSMLTQESMAIRILGVSKMPRVETCNLLLATGNNLVLHGDLTRRFLVSHLDPKTERPELRQFNFDPVQRCKEQRRELVAALLTMARWAQTKTLGYPPLGSFEVWSRLVRDTVVLVGLPDPCTVLEELHKEDPEREQAVEVLSEWHKEAGSYRTTVAEMLRRAIDGYHVSLREALDPVCGGPGGLSSKRLGRYLLRIKDRIFDGMVMRQERMSGATNAAAWSCKRVEAGANVSNVSNVFSGPQRENFPHDGGNKTLETLERFEDGIGSDPDVP